MLVLPAYTSAEYKDILISEAINPSLKVQRPILANRDGLAVLLETALALVLLFANSEAATQV